MLEMGMGTVSQKRPSVLDMHTEIFMDQMTLFLEFALKFSSTQ